MILATVIVLSALGGEVAADAAKPLARNVILVLSDDHRHDFLSFHPQAPEFLETPHLDRLAEQGCHLAEAFVSTSLCSPSRASILTGQYMHRHGVVDNQRAVPPGTVFFPQHLQAAGVRTAFVGKWHMGHDDDSPRPGFDHWASFRGQGQYFDPTLNINGERKTFEGYNADVLTDQALEWLGGQGEGPFFLFLSYKAVHYPFVPAPRHQGRYRDQPIDYPETMALTEENYATQSRWIRERRYGIHGIDHMQTGALDKDPVPDFDQLYRQFCETVHSLDENVGRVIDWVQGSVHRDDTMILYLGDNGFALGEHGFYDKRDAFEVSIRIPMIAWAPGRIESGGRVDQMVMNLDVGPTVLDAMGVRAPADAPRVDGHSFLPLMKGETVPWRDHILYEYHWEWNFPATPTTLAIRTKRDKFIYYHGLWDRDGYYELDTDPYERHNLIDVPAYQERVDALRDQLFRELEESGGLHIPLRPPRGDPFHDRKLKREP